MKGSKISLIICGIALILLIGILIGITYLNEDAKMLDKFCKYQNKDYYYISLNIGVGEQEFFILHCYNSTHRITYDFKQAEKDYYNKN